MGFISQLTMRLLTLFQQIFQCTVLYVLHHIIQGRNAHLNPRIALPQELDRIVFHMHPPLTNLSIVCAI